MSAVEGHTRTPWRIATKDDDLKEWRGVILGAVEPQTGNRTIVGRLYGEGPMTDANAVLVLDAPEAARQRDLLLAIVKTIVEEDCLGILDDEAARAAIAECEGETP